MHKSQVQGRVMAAIVAAGVLLAACTPVEHDPHASHPLIQSLKPAVPQVSIVTDGGLPIDEKRTYVPGRVEIDGMGAFESYDGPMEIRGRGNSTWTVGMLRGKKPYRLRLETAAELLDLPAERNWILLANYLDPTLMGNVIAFATAHLLDMPFTQHMIPVELFVNEEYMGSYLFTEHKEVKPNRIDVGDTGVLLELDTNFDEDFQFVSDLFDLPVMIQHPELDALSETEANEAAEDIEANFLTFERAVAGIEGELSELFDREAFAKYMVVFQLTANRELNHPKSVYMYSIDGGPYHMGPIWDFDWAYGYNSTNRLPFVNPRNELLLDGPSHLGGAFFTALMEDPDLRTAFKEEWEAFYEGQFPILLTYIEEYVALTRDAYSRDYVRWGDLPEQINRSADLDAELERILDWMTARADYINELVAGI